MSKILFSDDQIEKLKDHPCIEKISAKSIVFTLDFRMKVIKAYAAGLSPRQLFLDNGLDPEILGRRRFESCLHRWREQSQKTDGFTDMRKIKEIGRPRSKPRTPEEENAYLKDRLEYLEQENLFLKKLRNAERQVTFESQRKQNIKSSMK